MMLYVPVSRPPELSSFVIFWPLGSYLLWMCWSEGREAVKQLFGTAPREWLSADDMVEKLQQIGVSTRTFNTSTTPQNALQNGLAMATLVRCADKLKEPDANQVFAD